MVTENEKRKAPPIANYKTIAISPKLIKKLIFF